MRNQQTKTSLRLFNTFAIDVGCQGIVEIVEVDQLRSVLAELAQKQIAFLILGSGSNLVFSADFHGVVLHIASKGIELVEQNDESVLLSVYAGEIWDEFVGYCIDEGYFGLENLSGIPGTVGAAPVQNIGAYGVELKQRLVSLDAIEVSSGEMRRFSSEECQFGYRDSLFKSVEAGRYVITSVQFRLSTVSNGNNTLAYKGLADEFRKQGIATPSPADVRRVVKQIRDNKLPNPTKLANAGSFFKNPIVSQCHYQRLLKAFPEIVSFAVEGDQMKLAASWMIEQAGWKGYRELDAGVFEKHALILVNHGSATGEDILSLASKIQNSVSDRFGVELEIEPVVI